MLLLRIFNKHFFKYFNLLREAKEYNRHTHTHTHTHIYIYIYVMLLDPIRHQIGSIYKTIPYNTNMLNADI